MSHYRVSENRLELGVIVATHDRAELLSKRSIPSILSQSRPPDFLIVVDDSLFEKNLKENERYINSLESDRTSIAIIKNRRTLGACGAWNTGIDWIFDKSTAPESTYIAILDDDDSWLPNYLETCINTCMGGDYDMVAAGINRFESKNTQPVIYPGPITLEANDFLVGNGGIQGSNIFIRMSTMLMAGCFDESLQSSTDRDLCVRIADLGEVNYAPIPSNLVNHFAEINRVRLTTKGSEAKLSGLTIFWQKYCGRMSINQQEPFKKRAKQLFSWRPPVNSFQANNDFEMYPHLSPWIAPNPPKRPPINLFIGVITSEPETVWPLLQSISAQNLRTKILILDNGCPPVELENMANKVTKIGLDVVIIDQNKQQIDAKTGVFGKPYELRPFGQVGIAQARTMIQRYLGNQMKNDTESIGWLLDDDMRIDKRAKSFVSWLPILREANIDVVLGAYEGASPNPPLNGLRVQLVDLVHNLNWLNGLNPSESLPNRSTENKHARMNYPDYYYDLSRKHTLHRESPHWIEPVVGHETGLNARKRLLEGANRLIFGHPLTRPLVVNTPLDPLNEVKKSVNRGGITFILNSKTLTQTPNSIFHIDGQEARRSDMMWAIVNHYLRGFIVKSIGFPVTHITRGSAKTELNIPKVKAEIVGSALYAGLTDFLSSNPLHNLLFSKKDLAEIELIVEQNLSYRMLRLGKSFYRIRGLHRTLMNNFNEPLIQPLMNQLENLFSDENWSELSSEVSMHNTSDTIEFLSTIRDVAENYAFSEINSDV